LCKLGRFEPLKDERERLVTPMVRKNGALKAATWEEALEVVGSRLAPLAGSNGNGVAALVSSRLPAESMYLFKQVFADQFGNRSAASLDDGYSPSISSAFARELGASFEGKLDQLKTADCVLTIGADLAEEHQVAGFFIKRNLSRGTALIVVGSGENVLSASADFDLKITKDSEADLLLGLAAAIEELGLAKSKRIDLTNFTAEKASGKTGIDVDTLFEVARKIATAQQPVFVYGKGLASKGSVQGLKALIDLARVAGAYSENSSALISLKGQANSVVASLFGFDRTGEIKNQQAVYVALGDDTPSQRLIKQLEGVPFLAVQASYASPLTAKADVVLPVEMWAEQEGHYVSMDGRVQTTQGAIKAPEGVWSNMKVLEALATSLGVEAKADWQESLHQSVSAAALYLS